MAEKATRSETVPQRPEPNQRPEERTTKVRAITVSARQQPKPKAPPECVLVRALEKGFYGLDLDIIVRNPGEVFEMATSAMRPYPLGKGEHPIADAVIIEVNGQEYEVPGWVEIVDEAETSPEDFVKHGHAKEFRGQVSAEGGRTMDVL